MAEKHAERGRRFWIVQQHQDFTVVEGEKRPDLNVKKGERLKRLRGPYKTKEEANDIINGTNRAERLKARKERK